MLLTHQHILLIDIYLLIYKKIQNQELPMHTDTNKINNILLTCLGQKYQ